MSKVRFGIIGAGRRAREAYAPLIRTLGDKSELVAVCSRRLESAKSYGDKFAVPYYTDVSKMVEKEGPDAVIVVVSYEMNGPIGVQIADMGVNMILETPIAAKLSARKKARGQGPARVAVLRRCAVSHGQAPDSLRDFRLRPRGP